MGDSDHEENFEEGELPSPNLSNRKMINKVLLIFDSYF